MLFLSINMDYKSTFDQKVKFEGEKGKKWSLPLKTTLIYLYFYNYFVTNMMSYKYILILFYK